MHFRCFRLTRFLKNFLGKFFMIYVSGIEAVCCEVQTHLRFLACTVSDKCSGHIFTIYVSGNKVFFLLSSDACTF